MHRAHQGLRALSITAVLFVLAFPAQSQIQTISVNKGSGFIQTSPTTVVPEPVQNNYGFGVDVDGNGIGGIAAPTVTGPFNVGVIGSQFHNGGVLKYSQGDRGWRYGSNADDYGGPTTSARDSRFPNGTYNVTVNGVTHAIPLTGDAYPNNPVMTLTGGAWRDDRYVIDPSQPFTITTNQFNAYGTHADDLICIAILGGSFQKPFENVGPRGCFWGRARQVASATPGSKTLSYTLPAGTLVSGENYVVGVVFNAMTYKSTHASLPGATIEAAYEASTLAVVKAESSTFPVTITGSITPTVAQIIAQILYRASDVGSTGSVYSFAVAPTTRVQMTSLKDAIYVGMSKSTPRDSVGVRKGATLKDDPVPCTLAQVNAQGQLVQVTASTMQAAYTGTLTAQGTSVAVLNNVPTPNVAGASMYVGYGTSASAMLANGITQNAVVVPGATECRPSPPQAGWWWNPAEGGRGYSIESQGRNLFMAAYLYDTGGRATWLVASGPTAVDGSIFSGPLYACTGGVTISGAYRANNCTTSGQVSLTFNDPAHGRMVWPGGTVPIERFNTVPGGLDATPLPNQPESGWWWSAAENGRGFFIEWQGASATIAGYMYDDAGNPIWYIAVTPITNVLAQNGTWLQFANGMAMTGAYRAPSAAPSPGALGIAFTSGTTATMTMPGGRQVALTRFRF